MVREDLLWLVTLRACVRCWGECGEEWKVGKEWNWGGGLLQAFSTLNKIM